MFDIGFAELIIIGVVSLLVVGPERLPDAIRTASAWVNRIRRSFNDIKQEVQQELHNDAVMKELKELRDTGENLRKETQAMGRNIGDSLMPADKPTAEQESTVAKTPSIEAPSESSSEESGAGRD